MEQTSRYRNRSRLSYKKAQMTTLDFVFSIAIFVVLIAILYLSWFSKVQTTTAELDEFKAFISAQKAIKSICDSPGFPSHWGALNISPNSQQLKGIGVADSHSNIDERKLVALGYYYNQTQTYKNCTEKMGISPYDADIRIYYLNGTNVSVMGQAPVDDDFVLSTIQKPAVYKNETVIVRVRVWE